MNFKKDYVFIRNTKILRKEYYMKNNFTKSLQGDCVLIEVNGDSLWVSVEDLMGYLNDSTKIKTNFETD